MAVACQIAYKLPKREISENIYFLRHMLEPHVCVFMNRTLNTTNKQFRMNQTFHCSEQNIFQHVIATHQILDYVKQKKCNRRTKRWPNSAKEIRDYSEPKFLITEQKIYL